jgi:hypothetical protein
MSACELTRAGSLPGDWLEPLTPSSVCRGDIVCGTIPGRRWGLDILPDRQRRVLQCTLDLRTRDARVD